MEHVCRFLDDVDEAEQSRPRRAHWPKVIELLSSCDENSILLHSGGNSTKCFNILQVVACFRILTKVSISLLIIDINMKYETKYRIILGK